MNNFDGIDEPVVVSAVGKKRKASKSNHLREEIKKMRHSGGGKMFSIFFTVLNKNIILINLRCCVFSTVSI
jgi:hypothetical protein